MNNIVFDLKKSINKHNRVRIINPIRNSDDFKNRTLVNIFDKAKMSFLFSATSLVEKYLSRNL